MAYLSENEMNSMGFASLGQNVRISSRAALYEPEKIRLGDNARIDDFCVVSGRVELGRNAHVAALCNLAAGEPGIFIADFAGLAYGCHIFAQSDDYSGRTMTNPTVPDQYKTEIHAPVHVGRHAIIGTQGIVFPGADVAEGCAIGAGSVVTQPTEPWGIYVGNPARRMKDRVAVHLRRNLIPQSFRNLIKGKLQMRARPEPTAAIRARLAEETASGKAEWLVAAHGPGSASA
jgi:galactoside O-acetyltransferase